MREQRDRAEKEVKEEKDLHEREITDYKMKIHALESEVEKLQVRSAHRLLERNQNKWWQNNLRRFTFTFDDLKLVQQLSDLTNKTSIVNIVLVALGPPK